MSFHYIQASVGPLLGSSGLRQYSPWAACIPNASSVAAQRAMLLLHALGLHQLSMELHKMIFSLVYHTISEKSIDFCLRIGNHPLKIQHWLIDLCGWNLNKTL